MDINKYSYCNKYTFFVIVAMAAAVFGTVACSFRNETPITSSDVRYSPSAAAININTASAEELKKIPYIGEKLAGQIIEHRERYGLFRRPEHLILIPGISDSRYRKIRDLVRVD